MRLRRHALRAVVAAAIFVGGCGGAPLTAGTPVNAGATPSPVSDAPASTGGAGGQPGGTAPAQAATGATVSATRADGSCVENAYKLNGVCACQAGQPMVCGETCVDMTLDPDNCGACGRACGPTSTCNAGVCGPSVANVVAPAPGCVTLNLATAVDVLYWTDQGHGTVSAQPIGGGEAITIASGELNPTLVATDGTTLVWLTSPTTSMELNHPFGMKTSTIRALSLSGGGPRDLVTETNATGGIRGLVLSADGRTLYYSADTRVRAVPVAGGAAFDVGREERGGIPTALARDGNTIAFVTDLNTDVDAITVEDGVVATCGDADANGNFLGKNCARSRGCNPYAYNGGLVLRGATVYWGEDVGIDAATLGPTPSFKERVAMGASDSAVDASGVAGGPDQIYFGANEADGHVYRTPYALGSTAVAIARGQNVPSSMVVAGASLYWATADCSINSAPR